MTDLFSSAKLTLHIFNILQILLIQVSILKNLSFTNFQGNTILFRNFIYIKFIDRQSISIYTYKYSLVKVQEEWAGLWFEGN